LQNFINITYTKSRDEELETETRPERLRLKKTGLDTHL